MPVWTWTGLKAGKAATHWPQHGPDGQEGVLGMPRWDPRLSQRLQHLRRRLPHGRYRHRQGHRGG